MVHLYPQVTKSSDLFDVESAFKGATGAIKNDASEENKETIENGKTDRSEKTAQVNDTKASDRTNKCIATFCKWIIPFILILSVGAYMGYNYEKKIHELTEANRKCEAEHIEQKNIFNRVIAEYEQASMDYANEMDNYARSMEAKMQNEGATKEERIVPKTRYDEVKAVNDMADNGGGYSEQTGPVAVPRTETRTVHISNRGSDGKYGFTFSGTKIESVKAGWPADLCGVKAGDEIVSIDGIPVTTHDDVNRLGWKETGITLELRSKDTVPNPATRFVSMERGTEGYFGIYHTGTTITDVEWGSPMYRNGVSVGDQIISIDGVSVNTYDDVKREVLGKNYVTFEILNHS